MFPSGYTKYVAACKASGFRPDIHLARYATRYKMAGQLEQVVLLDHSAEAQALYLHAMRIAFAYSALESLEKHQGKSINIKNLEIANKLRLCSKKTREFFVTESRKKLSNSLQKFFISKNDSDLKPFITALRHSMFHGQFNPHASGLNSKKGISLLTEIEQLLFKALELTSEPIFKELVKQI